MTPEDEEFERIAQRQLAALKKATKATTEDAAVRAVHKVMAEYPDNFIDALKYDVAKRDSEFFTHSVEQPYDWSEWVCPDPKGYLMKCCDCGLVHEAEFGVVRYKSETEREDCDMVDDPNLQAVFRMRRSEQWSPADTAHRAGGLPMAEQPAQQEPVAWVLEWTFNGEERGRRLYDDETHCVFDAENDGGVCRPLVYGDTYPPAQQQEPKLPEFYARFEDGLVSVYQRREDATPLLLLRENLPDEQPAQQQEPVAAPEPRGLIDIGRIFRGEDK